MNAVAPLARDGTHDIMESVIVHGDLSKLKPQERVEYYNAVCRSVGLNPLTRPFEYLRLSGKEVLYAKRDAADQLRKINGISLRITHQEKLGDLYCVTVEAVDKTGRTDSDMGAVPISGLKGDALANAMLKAVTKAKRRVTLSISGLGLLDETEVEAIPDAQPLGDSAPPSLGHDPVTGEVRQPETPKLPQAFVVHLINGKARIRKNAAEWRKDMLGGIAHFGEGEDLARFEDANAASMAELEAVAPNEVAEVRRAFDARLRGNDRDLNDSVEDIGRG